MDFGREVCGELSTAEKKEWLVTNGIGGFAMGTAAGLLSRRYHGLLVAALEPPLGRTLLLTKIDETLQYQGKEFEIFVNRWQDDFVEPHGYRFLERFYLEGTTPVWRYAILDAQLEKRIWMERGANTTYIQYRLIRGSAPAAVSAKALVNYRDYHSITKPGWLNLEVTAIEDGLNVSSEGAADFRLLSSSGSWFPRNEWYEDYYLKEDAYRGEKETVDANLFAGHCNFYLSEGSSVTLVASSENRPMLDGTQAYLRKREYESHLLQRSRFVSMAPSLQTSQAKDALVQSALQQLVLAADQFIVDRKLKGGESGRSIIAGYPWFSDWGRDTMIALPGLTQATGRSGDAAKILRTFAEFEDQGQLPNRFPDEGEEPEYNTADAALWFFEAVRSYYAYTRDVRLISELYPVLEEIISWHLKGTRFNIHWDPSDGLIYAGQPGVQLTWMDARIEDWVVTPRLGKPIEISALWFNALEIMVELSRILKKSDSKYLDFAAKTREGFYRYWNDSTGFCFDVLDGPVGNDESLRPNQLLAVSLTHSPLTRQQGRGVVDSCTRHLLTSFGLRSLAGDHPEYIGTYGGDRWQRDGAYHQGTVWGWLIGPYLGAHLKIYGDTEFALSVLDPFLKHLNQHGLGSISEIFDGDPPHTPRGCPFQAWSVAEVLRIMAQIRSDSGKNLPDNESDSPAK